MFLRSYDQSNDVTIFCIWAFRNSDGLRCVPSEEAVEAVP